jgi:hypothetical protein
VFIGTKGPGFSCFTPVYLCHRVQKRLLYFRFAILANSVSIMWQYSRSTVHWSISRHSVLWWTSQDYIWKFSLSLNYTSGGVDHRKVSSVCRLVSCVNSSITHQAKYTCLKCSSESDGRSGGQHIPRLLWKLKVHCHFHKGHPQALILSLYILIYFISILILFSHPHALQNFKVMWMRNWRGYEKNLPWNCLVSDWRESR